MFEVVSGSPTISPTWCWEAPASRMVVRLILAEFSPEQEASLDYRPTPPYLLEAYATLREILSNQPEIRLYLPCPGRFGTKRTSVWLQIDRKMVNTIWFWFDSIRSRIPGPLTIFPTSIIGLYSACLLCIFLWIDIKNIKYILCLNIYILYSRNTRLRRDFSHHPGERRRG